MCGRYVSPDESVIERLWKIDRRNSDPFSTRYNVAPTTQVPVILQAQNGSSELHSVRWGLIPHWWKRPQLPSLSFNARSEEAASKPMWRDSLKHRRCLMPALGWYEWNENEQVRSTSGKLVNQPYYLFSPASEALAIAGLWSVFEPEEATHAILSCALMTKEAAPSIAQVHHRMPVILQPEHEAAWLDPATPAPDIADIIAAARVDFESYRVSTRVNNARTDTPDLLNRIDDSNPQLV